MNDIKKFLSTVTGKIVGGILFLVVVIIVIVVVAGSNNTPATNSIAQNYQPIISTSSQSQPETIATSTPTTSPQVIETPAPVVKKVVTPPPPTPVVTPVVAQTLPPPVTYYIDITFPGQGEGMITSYPAGVTCVSGKCSGTFNAGTEVTLTAVPTGGSVFSGWTTTDDSCPGTSTCKVIVSDNIWVMATFNPPAPSPFTISGSGNSASRQFTLQGGLAVFNMQYSGTDNFIVDLLDDQGNQVANISNAIGSYSGSKAVQIQSSGSYLFNVQSTGSWNIGVSQPQPTNVSSASTLTGNGSQATQFFNLSQGLHTFTMNYIGTDNFIVDLLDSSGNEVDNLANQINSFSGSKAVGIDTTGPYLLNVQATGNWSISVQ